MLFTLKKFESCPAPPTNDFRTFCMSNETEKVYQKLEEAVGSIC